MQKTPCPCGSQNDLSQCCLPFIEGKKQPLTAEELLRARYTAFVRGDVDFILNTHHSKTRHEVKREEVEDWSKNSEWLGLTIEQKEAGQASDERGAFVFCAKYRSRKKGAEVKEEEHWEQSLFEKEGGQWRFLDARGIHQGPYVRTEPKIGRNDPCSCGSGKKFKKCCAA